MLSVKYMIANVLLSILGSDHAPKSMAFVPINSPKVGSEALDLLTLLVNHQCFKLFRICWASVGYAELSKQFRR